MFGHFKENNYICGVKDDGAYAKGQFSLPSLRPLRRRVPLHAARTDAMGNYPHQAVHHLRGAETILLPQLPQDPRW